MTKTRLLGLMTLLAAFGSRALAFEDTKILPKGVRNIDLRSVNTDFDQTTDNAGSRQPLATPLQAQLTFDQIAKGQSDLKAAQLKAFLKSNGIDSTQSVGQFTADLKGHLSVVAPIMAYGFTDKLTVALGVPFYDATTNLNVGFQPNQNAQSFLSLLADPKNNQTSTARDAASDFNNAVGKLNQKLRDHHYAALDNWHGTGLGDMTLAGKYQAFDREHLAFAAEPGLVMPTGRTDDPDNLTDVAFGNGVWAPYMEFVLDEKTPGHFRITQYVKYTDQLPGTKTVRAVTDDEKIAVDYTNTRYKLGDMLDTGASVKWEPNFGAVAGVGYIFHHKYGDIYRGAINPETRDVLQRNSEQKANEAEFLLGYSTVPLYFAHEVPVPLELDLTYNKQLVSRNMPVTDLVQLDFNLYF